MCGLNIWLVCCVLLIKGVPEKRNVNEKRKKWKLEKCRKKILKWKMIIKIILKNDSDLQSKFIIMAQLPNGIQINM